MRTLPTCLQSHTSEDHKIDSCLDSLEGFALGNLPDISIQEVASQAWQPIGPLSWGANAIPDPARFVDREAKVAVRVDTTTIDVPISVDLSAIFR